MDTEQDVKMLAEVDKALDAAAEKTGNKVCEQLSDFSTSNMSFEDITAVIMDHTEDLFSLTGTQDRFSSEYLSSCRILLKAVDHLGSSFITKTALTARNYDVPKLRSLSAGHLQEMVSFHIRKCDAAMKEMREKGMDFSFEHYQLLLALANSSQRLCATQNKAFDIREWLIKPNRLAASAMAFTKINGHYVNNTNDSRPQSFRSKSAYGLRTEVLDEYERNRKEPSAEESCEQQRSLMPAADKAVKTHTPDDKNHEALFEVINRRQPGMGDILRAADKKASAMGFTRQEKALLFNALQHETARDYIADYLRDPNFCTGNPEEAASFRRVQAILDG